MEFPHELKRVYPHQIADVIGNADTLTIVLKQGTDSKSFINQLKTDFNTISEKHTLYLTIENSDHIEKVYLG